MVKSGKSLRKVGPLATSPSHLMHRALQLALDIYSEEMGADGLTQRQFAVLEAASLKAGLTQTELVRMTGSCSSISRSKKGSRPPASTARPWPTWSPA